METPLRRADVWADAPVVVARRTGGRHATRRPVTHAYAALGFHTGGRSRVEQRGIWTLEAGDVLLVPAGQAHRFVEARRPEVWGLGFCVPCVAAEAGALLDPFERVRGGGAPVVRIPGARQAFLEGLFKELAEPAAVAVQRSLLTLILNEVARAAGPAPAAPAKGVVAASLSFIERNCLRPLTLSEVAAAVGRSPAYVTTALSRATGRSALDWIIGGRMAEARRLLLHSDEMVDVIAERVGYTDPTHFIRMFRRHHGATPAAWRQQALG
jgi:AraC-like DNA-binding protein